MTIQEATTVANRANEELKPVKFIGQFENVSKWITRTCSVYADPIETYGTAMDVTDKDQMQTGETKMGQQAQLGSTDKSAV